MIELVLVLAIAFILLGIAAPRLMETSSAVAVTEARSKVTAEIAMARATATRFGRISTLVVDAAGDRLSILVDTSALGAGLMATLQLVDLWSDLGVNLQATQPLICFDPRGLAATVGACTGQAMVIRVQRGLVRDSVIVSAIGRVTP